MAQQQHEVRKVRKEWERDKKESREKWRWEGREA